MVWCEKTRAFGAELTSYENREALPDNHMLPQRCSIADLWTVVFSCAALISKPPTACCLTKIQLPRGVGRHTSAQTESKKLKTNCGFNSSEWVLKFLKVRRGLFLSFKKKSYYNSRSCCASLESTGVHWIAWKDSVRREVVELGEAGHSLKVKTKDEGSSGVL